MAERVSISDSSKNLAKAQIVACVEMYRKLYPREYAWVVAHVKEERAKLRDKRLGTTGMESTDTLANIYPDVLEASLSESLMGAPATEDGVSRFKWFKSSEGNLWFCKRFPEFTVPEEV